MAADNHNHNRNQTGGTGTTTPATHLKIAILLNSYRSPYITQIRDSYARSLGSIPNFNCALTFFYPADASAAAADPTTGTTSTTPEKALAFPSDPSAFDLIIIGGGNVDSRGTQPWVLRVQKFIQDTISRYSEKPKICGICWGHQTISLLFGGEVVDMAVPELGVTETRLTELGRRFFFSPEGEKKEVEVLRLQQHHRRAVAPDKPPPKGFYELLEGNEALLSHSGTILTFQGHPEKDAETAKLRIRDAARWFNKQAASGRGVSDSSAGSSTSPGVGSSSEDSEKEEERRALNEVILKKMEMEHDGQMIWERVLRWAVRPASETLEMLQLSEGKTKKVEVMPAAVGGGAGAHL